MVPHNTTLTNYRVCQTQQQGLIVGKSKFDHMTKVWWICTRGQSVPESAAIYVLAHKAVYGVGPVYPRELIRLYIYMPGRSLRCGDSLQLARPRTRAKAVDAVFSVAAADLWNGLPTTIKGIHDEDSFKAALKTQFFLTSIITHGPSLYGLLIDWTFIDTLV